MGGHMKFATVKCVLRTLIPCALLAASLGSPSVTAAAVEAGDIAQSPVSLASLDLTTRTGIEQLYVRVTSVARQQCQQDGVRDLNTAMHVRRCAEQAIARLVDVVNVPALTDYYHAKTGKPIPQ
jgi:UrcA family protein